MRQRRIADDAEDVRAANRLLERRVRDVKDAVAGLAPELAALILARAQADLAESAMILRAAGRRRPPEMLDDTRE